MLNTTVKAMHEKGIGPVTPTPAHNLSHKSQRWICCTQAFYANEGEYYGNPREVHLTMATGKHVK